MTSSVGRGRHQFLRCAQSSPIGPSVTPVHTLYRPAWLFRVRSRAGANQTAAAPSAAGAHNERRVGPQDVAHPARDPSPVDVPLAQSAFPRQHSARPGRQRCAVSPALRPAPVLLAVRVTWDCGVCGRYPLAPSATSRSATAPYLVETTPCTDR